MYLKKPPQPKAGTPRTGGSLPSLLFPASFHIPSCLTISLPPPTARYFRLQPNKLKLQAHSNTNFGVRLCQYRATPQIGLSIPPLKPGKVAGRSSSKPFRCFLFFTEICFDLVMTRQHFKWNKPPLWNFYAKKEPQLIAQLIEYHTNTHQIEICHGMPSWAPPQWLETLLWLLFALKAKVNKK